MPNYDGRMIWEDYTMSSKWNLHKIPEDIKKYRVKYLDQEDIESLGETVYKDGKIYFSNNELPPLAITFSGDDNSIIIEGIISKCVLFIGKIKNKSELKRILKQIGA
jgi:hypothetical protein